MTPPAVSRSHERSPQDAGGAAAAGIPGAALPAVRPRSASHDGDGVGRPSAAIITRAARWSAPSRPRVSAVSPASTCRGTRASRRAGVTGGPRGSTRTGRTRSPRCPRRRRSRTNRRVRDGLGIAMDQRQCDAVICGHTAGGRQVPRGVVDSDNRRAEPFTPTRPPSRSRARSRPCRSCRPGARDRDAEHPPRRLGPPQALSSATQSRRVFIRVGRVHVDVLRERLLGHQSMIAGQSFAATLAARRRGSRPGDRGRAMGFLAGFSHGRARAALGVGAIVAVSIIVPSAVSPTVTGHSGTPDAV